MEINCRLRRVSFFLKMPSIEDSPTFVALLLPDLFLRKNCDAIQSGKNEKDGTSVKKVIFVNAAKYAVFASITLFSNPQSLLENEWKGYVKYAR